MIHILILENDLFLSKSLTEALECQKYKITQSHTLARTSELLETERYDLLLCDRVLDDGDGLDIVRYVSDIQYETRIIMMSQKGRLVDKLDGYKDGVDDYIVKPFSFQELIARIKSLLNKNKIDIKNRYMVGDMQLVPDTGLVLSDSHAIKLRKKEMGLLLCLTKHKNYIVSRNQLINTVWPDVSKQPVKSTVDVYIRRIRSKLGNYGKHIQTSRGFGYSVVDQV